MIVEICANNYESARNAQLGGATRIELCENLAVGGITPSESLIKKVLSKLSIPVHVLVRPRAGNFVYSEEEIDQIKNTIELCKELGCAGIVSGALTPQDNVDLDQTAALLRAASGMEFTFHRAFDVVKDPAYALKQLSELNIDRVLSSGQEKTAQLGLELLKKFQGSTNIEIMPGGGINSNNAKAFKDAGFKNIHLSAILKKKSDNRDLFNTGVEGTSDLEEIRRVVSLVSVN